MSSSVITLVDLVRHGETEGGHLLGGRRGDRLTQRGWNELERALTVDETWDAIVSSPLDRCALFARALAERLDKPLEIDHALQEMNFGRWQGRSPAELFAVEKQSLMAFWERPSRYSPPGGETMAGFQTRVLNAWYRLTDRHVGERILMILHAGTIRMILTHVLCMPLNAVLRLEVLPAAVSRVRLEAYPEGRDSVSLVFHAGRL